MGWDDVGKSSGSSDFLKIEDGETVKLHVLSEEPYSYDSIFNSDIQRGARVAPGFSQEGVETRKKHAFIAWSLDKASAVIWEVGNQVAGAIKNIFEQYGSLSEVDLVVTRHGTSLKTKYGIVPVPTKFEASVIEGVELPNLEEILTIDSDEDIQKIVAGEDPRADFPPTEEAAPKASKPAPAKAAVKAPAPAAAPGGNEKMLLIKQLIATFATKPKYKDPKVKLAAIKAVNKTKSMIAQLDLNELKKLLASVKK